MLRDGTGEPLLLLHRLAGSERVWRDVLPLLARGNDTIAPTALGHRGGRPAGPAPVRVGDVVDDAERTLDELGIGRAHLAGDSMGGQVALELARRDRAESVCVFSPGGCLGAPTGDELQAIRELGSVVSSGEHTGRPFPQLRRSAAVHRFASSDHARPGHRLTPAQISGLADDLRGCTVAEDLLGSAEGPARLDPAPCEVTLTWSARDRTLPPDISRARARRLVPSARWRVLPTRGRIPALEDPRLVADAIRDHIAHSTGIASA